MKKISNHILDGYRNSSLLRIYTTRCPQCGAKSGEWCVSKSGKINYGWHRSRSDKADRS